MKSETLCPYVYVSFCQSMESSRLTGARVLYLGFLHQVTATIEKYAANMAMQTYIIVLAVKQKPSWFSKPPPSIGPTTYPIR